MFILANSADPDETPRFAFLGLRCVYYKSKKEGKDQESIQSSTTPEAGYQVTTSQVDITNESQEVSPFPAGGHKASTTRRA